MNDIVSEVRSALDDEEVISTNVIPIHCFSKKNNRSTKLINNESESNSLRGRNSRFEFSFSEPMYISSITVKTKGYSKYDDLEFFWNSIQRTSEKSITMKFTEDKTSVSIKEIVTDFAIKPPKKYIANPEIESVTVWGLTLSEFNK